MNKFSRSLIGICAITLTIACQKNGPEKETPVVMVATGNISSSVNQFREKLGSLNTLPGNSFGRREINWDGVPDSFSWQTLPADFFNPVGTNANQSLQRGLHYQSSGDFRASANAFSEVAANTAGDLDAFSGNKVFANIQSLAWQVNFQVAAKTDEASVAAFGVVFVGVDLSNTSYLEPFNGTESLGKYYAPAHTNSSNHSFVGVYFQHTRITSVKLVHGNATFQSGEKDISKGGTRDIVALDDFIYSEPLKN